MPTAGYEYLLSYKLTVPIYDYTVEFCRRWIDKKSRTVDQMTQAARSGMQNIAEGYSQESLASYIKLCGVAYGSLEELLQDYLSYSRQHKIPLWGKESVQRELGELRELWEMIRKTKTFPESPDFPELPESPERAVNLLVTLIHQASYLLAKLITSLKAKHEKEGGFSENLLRSRLAYRRHHA